MIRRSRTTAPSEAPVTASRRITRPGVARARSTATPAAAQRNFYNEVTDQLKLIATLDAEQEELTRRRKEVEEGIQKIMEEGRLTEADDGVFKAEFKGSSGRATTEIDPKKFQKFLGPNRADDFWSCVKVGVTEAKQFITEAEIPKVGTITPGKAGPSKLSISRKKKAK